MRCREDFFLLGFYIMCSNYRTHAITQRKVSVPYALCVRKGNCMGSCVCARFAICLAVMSFCYSFVCFAVCMAIARLLDAGKNTSALDFSMLSFLLRFDALEAEWDLL